MSCRCTIRWRERGPWAKRLASEDDIYMNIIFFQFQTVKIFVLSKPEPRIIRSAFGQNGRTTKYFVDVIIREDATRHEVSTFKRELAEKLKVEKCYKTLKCTHHQMYGYEMKGDSVACNIRRCETWPRAFISDTWLTCMRVGNAFTPY